MVLSLRATIRDSLDAEEARALTLQLHEVVKARAEQLQGFVAEVAQSVTVYFGFPSVLEGAEERACTLALAVVSEAQRLSEGVYERAGAPRERRDADRGAVLAVHVGIHAGLSIVGLMGGSGAGGGERFVAQGEAASVAQQLQHAAAANEVLLSHAVQDKACSRFALDERTAADGAAVKLQGQNSRLFILRGSQQSLPAVPACASGHLVGRGAEVERLLRLIDISHSESESVGGQAVVMTGAAGHGKSALVRSVLERVRASGTGGDEGQTPLVLMAQSSAMLSESTPLQGARQWLVRWHHEDLSSAAVVERVLAAAGISEAPEVASLAPALGALVCSATGAEGPPAAMQASLVPHAQQLDALERVLLGLARPAGRGLILGIEDAEYVDAATLELLGRLVAQLGTLRLFLLVAVRSSKGVQSEAMRAWLREHARCVHHVEVGVLAPASARELIAAAATAGELPSVVVDFIIEHTGGIPLHLEQMITAFVESSLLFLDDQGCYELEGSLHDMDLPTSLSDSIRLRLATVRQADPPLDTLLKLCAVMGGSLGC